MTTPQADSNPIEIAPFSLKATYQAPLIEGVLETEIPSLENPITQVQINTATVNCELIANRLPIPGQKDATYKTALILVAQIDEGVTKGNRHYYNRAGELLPSLDSVIRAILTDNLLMAEGCQR